MTQIPGPLRALLETGGQLVRRSSTGRTLLGRAHGLLGEDGFPRAMRGITEVLEHAREQTSEPLKRGRGEEVAVTPVGVVYRADVDGEPVAIRVRRPGLDSAVRNDLALLDVLAPAVSGVFGALDTGALMRAIRERTLDELDFEHEAATHRQVARAMRGVEGIRVPRAYGDESEPDAFVCEFVEGPTLAEARPDDPGAVARALVQAHVRAARAGLAPVDPRPNHVVLSGDGCVLLGAGNAASVDRARSEAFLEALEALRSGEDPSSFVAIVAGRLQLLPSDHAERAHGLMRELIGPFLDGPARIDEPALAEMGERALGRLGELVRLGAVVTPQPGDLWLARMAGQLVATLAALEATEDWVATALAA